MRKFSQKNLKIVLTMPVLSCIINLAVADVAELADALDLGSSVEKRECSSHFIRTIPDYNRSGFVSAMYGLVHIISIF